MIKKIIFGLISLILLTLTGFFVWLQFNKTSDFLSPLASFKKSPEPSIKPLEKYTFVNLKERGGIPSQINLEKILKEEDKFTAYLFSFTSDNRKITGLAHLPKKPGKLAVIVMLRGYVDQEIYQTGVGTQKAGEVYAGNGFITLGSDFLGYGQSEMPPNNVWGEERFLRLTTTLDLLESIKNLSQANPDKVCLWGHSNGGMMALSILELSQKNYPTSLWAPVSKFFPYDILYYMDEFDDHGKALRKNLAEFEQDYDTNNYSFDQYLDWIQAPIQVHQGTDDQYVPLKWSENLIESIKEQKKDIVLYTYNNADHNLKGSWDTVVQKDINFYQTKLNNNN